MGASRLALSALALVATLGLSGCTVGPTPTPLPPHPTFATPTPAPTPGPDTQETVSVGLTGVGVWQLVTIPVAIVHNDSAQHAVTGITIHFTPTRNGAPLQPVDTAPFDLAPGQAIAVAADCTDSCPNANGTQAAVVGGTWVDPARVATVTASGPAFQRVSGSGSGQGTVTGTLVASTVPAGSTVDAFAVCLAGGAIVGGGSDVLVWQASGAAVQESVSVIVSRTPDRCDLYGVPGA